MPLRALLVEGNMEKAMTLRQVLDYTGAVTFVEQVDTVEKALHYLQNNPVDAVFTNIQPGPATVTSDGCYLIRIATALHPEVQFVLYGCFEDLQYRNILSYCTALLVWPFDPDAVQYVTQKLLWIHRLLQHRSEAVNRSIMVKTQQGYQMLAIRDILFIERSNRKNRIVTTDGREITLVRYTLDELERQLQGSGFYRCYQSFIVNLSKIRSIRADKNAKNYVICFEGDSSEIVLSRSKYAELVGLLKERCENLSI